MASLSNSPFTSSRRAFLSTSLKASALAAIIGNPLLAQSEPVQTPTLSPHPLNILILGGTSFLGPQQIDYALRRGHRISIFTRGKTQPTVHKQLFKQVEHLIGDRNDNLEALKGRKWDAVIDNSGYQVEWTLDTAELLRDHVDTYLYTSSTGVYYPYLGSDIGEDTKLVTTVPDNLNEEQKLEYGYGVMKTNSELAAKAAFGTDRTIVVRPTYMMGPGDRTDRFTYWPVRLAKGGEIMVPGKPIDPVQYIDVRDVSHWMIRLIEQRAAGTYNAVGPASATNMQQFVYGAHAAFSSAVSFVSIPDYEFLTAHKVPYIVPWIMPVGENFGSSRASNQLAITNGLTFIPLAQSVRDIYEWWNSEAVTEERRMKLEKGEKSIMAREAAILAAWKKDH